MFDMPFGDIRAVGNVKDIETKYRVYFPFLENKEKKNLPNAQWEATKKLAKELNVGCTDLTDSLRKASERLLLEEKFTFWMDDSHWNGFGIAVAAEAVKNIIDAHDNH